MTGMRRRIREKGSVSLKGTAYALTIVFIVISLVPMAWMISSSLKDSKSIYAFPPRWLPKTPQTVTVTLNFSGAAPAEREFYEKEAAKAIWYAWKKHQNEPIGEMRVIGIRDGRAILEASTPSYLFTVGRPLVVPSQVFTDAVMNTKFPIIKQRGFTKFVWFWEDETEAGGKEFGGAEPGGTERSEAQSGTPALLVRDFLRQADFMQAEVVAVEQRDNWRRLFDNYLALWAVTDSDGEGLGMVRYLLNSIYVTLASVAAQFVVGGLAGYALSRLISPKWAVRWTLFFVATIMIPEIAILVPLYLTMEQLGLVNTLWGIILPHTAWGIVIFLFKGFFDQLPGELLQAARIDGASELGIYRKIVIPMSLPIFTVVGVMTFIAVWNEFMWPLVVARKESAWTLTVALNDFQNRQTLGTNVLMSSLTVATVPMLLVFLFCQRLVERGAAWTGVKG